MYNIREQTLVNLWELTMYKIRELTMVNLRELTMHKVMEYHYYHH